MRNPQIWIKNMSNVLEFRNRMAENGCEITPQKAEKMLIKANEFREYIYQKARDSHESIEFLFDLSLDQKKNICWQFSEFGCEVTVSELEKLINLISQVYEEEKLF